MSKDELYELSKINIEDVDRESLHELTEVKIDPNADVTERVEAFFNQIGNPYCFLVNGTPVQILFANHNKTLDDCLYNYLKNSKDLENMI